MIETYQQEVALKRAEPQDASFATVGEIFADGVSLIFDGEETASTKHYKVNAFVVFHAADRVRIIKDSGTYVVEYPIGNPKTSFAANTATSATTATTADKAKAHTGSTLKFFDAASGSVKKSVPDLSTSATLAQTITKLNDLLTALKAYSLLS